LNKTKYSEKELYEILEKQRGTFCQIAFLYFTTVIIGLGLVASLQATIGPSVLYIAIIFLVVLTIIFTLLTCYLQKPVEEIDKQVAETMKHIIGQGTPDEEEI
jgi:Flp pilus assembly protein TadB